MRTIFYCDPIDINDLHTREDIVKKIINIFIDNENRKRGKGIQFWYPVERISYKQPPDNILYILRPGGLQKWNFDFKVNVTPDMGFAKGKHGDVQADFQAKKEEDPVAFDELLQALTDIYECVNDVDKVLAEHPNLKSSFHQGADVEVILKVLKWMFIMEDIVYWNYEGRTKLYNFLKEI
jgi:hypothetical protein